MEIFISIISIILSIVISILIIYILDTSIFWIGLFFNAIRDNDVIDENIVKLFSFKWQIMKEGFYGMLKKMIIQWCIYILLFILSTIYFFGVIKDFILSF
ncbi:hypothetical protein D0T56_09255 [Dysgonomonas sp. 520]|nr:hypothetical protein [Dysgonomonas sp. 520]